MKRFSFQLKVEEYQTDLKLDHLNKLPKDISNILFSSGKYQVQSDVSYQNFKTFIDCFISNSSPPTINDDNIYDFHQLSNEFNIMKDYYLSERFEPRYRISTLNKLKSEDSKDKSLNEQYISKNLDVFIENHENEMKTLPIQMQYNIFYNKNRRLNDHDRAYKFITNQQIQNYFILLPSIDSSKLSDEMFEDSIIKCNERSGFIPQFSMENLQLRLQGSEREQRLKRRVHKREDELHYLSKKLDNLHSKYEKEIHILNKEISKNHYMIDYQKKEIGENNQKIKSQQKRLDYCDDKIHELSKSLSNSKDELNESIKTIKKQEIKLQENESTIKLQENRLRELEDIIRTQENKISEQDKIIKRFQGSQNEDGNNTQDKSFLQKLYDFI